MLSIRNLRAAIDGKEILKGISLEIGEGETHTIMGTNGSGKSTLANILAGREGYQVTAGEVLYFGRNLLELAPEERAGEGIFLAFQYPVELPGVLETYFLRTACNAVRKYNKLDALGVREFSALLDERLALLHLDAEITKRAVNEGFSGGEKKRNEVLQMALLSPRLGILDETDSGLDIDALQIVAEGVNRLKAENGRRSFLVITHYQRLLDFIVPDVVHVMLDGRIAKSGGKELALELEERGYNWVKEETGVSGS